MASNMFANQPDQLRLELTATTTLQAVEEALGSNSTFEELAVFFRPSFSDNTRQAELQRFLQTIVRRSNLKKLILSSDEVSPYTLPVSVLSEVLNLGTSLQRLHLGFVELSGSRTDFDAFEESVQNHESLCELHSTAWLDEATRMNVSLDAFLRAFVASRSLQSLFFHPSFLPGGLTSVTTGSLCTSPSLLTLDIGECNLIDENIVAMATALEQNEVLVELHVICSIGEAGSLALARCLRHNANLQVMRMHNTNTNITEETSDDYNAQIAGALKENASLKRFALHGVKLSEASQHAFVEMLKDNHVLEEVSLLELEEELKAEVSMYELLNQCGRQKLLQNGGVTKVEWIECLAQLSFELDCLYYLLSTKPSLCDTSTDCATSTETKTIKRRVSDPDDPPPRKAHKAS